MKTLKVELGDRSYPIYIGQTNFDRIGEILSLYYPETNFVIISDKHVFSIYGQQLEAALEKREIKSVSIVVPEGEKSKSIETYFKILTKMLQHRVTRSWMVLALGGGVVGDLAGFAAASFMRGIPFIQIPTSLLAQVDSSVGGKTGINHPLAKNTIGAFYQPKLVWIDTAVLKTLEPVEVISGMAEVLKYGVIYDREFFAFCEHNLDDLLALTPDVMIEAIYQCCAIKAKIVAEDERETGLRAILNFGHTIGHAIEAVFKYEGIKHGEAILWGMLAEAWIAMDIGLLDSREFDRMNVLFDRVPLQTRIDNVNFDALYAAMQLDKKAVDARLRFALPTSIGETEIVIIEKEATIKNGFLYAQQHGWTVK